MSAEQTLAPEVGLQPSILLVDDHDVFRERLARAFQGRGFDVRTASNAEDALRLATEDSPEKAVLDLRMPGNSGLQLLQELKKIDPTIQIIILTGYGSIATTIDAMRLGASSYLAKPADVDDILAAFERAEQPPLEPTPLTYTAPSLARTEWEHINRVLSDCGGNISKAAKILGLHRRSLQRKLQKYPPPQ